MPGSDTRKVAEAVAAAGPWRPSPRLQSVPRFVVASRRWCWSRKPAAQVFRHAGRVGVWVGDGRGCRAIEGATVPAAMAECDRILRESGAVLVDDMEQDDGQ